MKYDFDKVYDRKGTACFKYDALTKVYGREDIVPLWVADMDFAVAPEILNKISARLEHPIFGYNFQASNHFQSFITYVEKRHGWSLQEDWLQMSPGIVPTINFIVNIFTKEKDKILIQQPVYPPFREAVSSHQRKLVVNNLLEENGKYTIDFADLEEKLAECKLFIFCSPHNPVGRVWTKEELMRIGNLCKKYKVLLVTDEIHNDLIYSGYKHIPIAMLEKFSNFTISLMAPSKSYNIAGLQSSVIICPNQDMLSKLRNELLKYHIFGSNAFGTIAFQTAYDQGEAWLEELLKYLEANRDYVYDRVKSMPIIKMEKPEGTYLAWLNFKESQMTDEELMDFCTNKAKLALNPGINFGKAGSGFMRLNFGCPRSILEKSLDNLEIALKEFIK